MVASAVSRSLLLCLLGFSCHAAAACTRSITAQQGDTCASLASQAGITVTDFLRSNPGVTSCSALVPGASYCVQGTADSAPTPSGTGAAPASSSPTGLKVSTDGTCGQGVTCAGSSYGNCCSAHGYCGSSADYCGSGCQAAFGSCGSGGSPGSSGPVTTVTASVTVTVTSTSTVGVTRTSIATSTSVVVSTATSVQTATTTQTVALTSYQIDTITTVVTSTSTRVVTSGICPVTTIWQTAPCPITAGPPTNTWTIGPPTTVTPGVGQPSPTLPGTPRRCKQYDVILPGDTCRSIAQRNGLSLLDFYGLNPSVSGDGLTITLCLPDSINLVLSGLCKINCDALWEGYYVCVGR